MLKMATVALNALLLASACSSDSEEEKVRAVIAAAVTASEARSTSGVMKLVADDYADSRGLEKTQLQQYLRGYFLTHPKIELVTRIRSIEFETANRARVQIDFAMVGTQRQGDGDSLAGEMEALQVELRRHDSEWLVTRADRRNQ